MFYGTLNELTSCTKLSMGIKKEKENRKKSLTLFLFLHVQHLGKQVVVPWKANKLPHKTFCHPNYCCFVRKMN